MLTVLTPSASLFPSNPPPLPPPHLPLLQTLQFQSSDSGNERKRQLYPLPPISISQEHPCLPPSSCPPPFLQLPLHLPSNPLSFNRSFSSSLRLQAIFSLLSQSLSPQLLASTLSCFVLLSFFLHSSFFLLLHFPRPRAAQDLKKNEN